MRFSQMISVGSDAFSNRIGKSRTYLFVFKSKARFVVSSSSKVMKAAVGRVSELKSANSSLILMSYACALSNF